MTRTKRAMAKTIMTIFVMLCFLTAMLTVSSACEEEIETGADNLHLDGCFDKGSANEEGVADTEETCNKDIKSKDVCDEKTPDKKKCEECKKELDECEDVPTEEEVCPEKDESDECEDVPTEEEVCPTEEPEEPEVTPTEEPEGGGDDVGPGDGEEEAGGKTPKTIVSHGRSKSYGENVTILPRIDEIVFIESPETEVFQNTINLTAKYDLTSEQEKILKLETLWKIFSENGKYFWIGRGNNITVYLPNGNYTIVLEVKDNRGREIIITKEIHVDAYEESIRPESPEIEEGQNVNESGKERDCGKGDFLIYYNNVPEFCGVWWVSGTVRKSDDERDDAWCSKYGNSSLCEVSWVPDEVEESEDKRSNARWSNKGMSLTEQNYFHVGKEVCGNCGNFSAG